MTRYLVEAVAIFGLAWAGAQAFAQTPNSAGVGGVTAQQQPTNSRDAEITRQIRRELVRRPLSTRAKNVMIVTSDGAVVLRGEVATENEMRVVQKIARGVTKNVTNEIVVSPK